MEKDYVDVLLEDYLGDDTPEAELTNGRDLGDEDNRVDEAPEDE